MATHHRRLLEISCDVTAVLINCAVVIVGFFLLQTTPVGVSLGIWNIGLGSIAGIILALFYEYLIRDHLFSPAFENDHSVFQFTEQEDLKEANS